MASSRRHVAKIVLASRDGGVWYRGSDLMKLKFFAICLASMAISSSASANLIQNGDFSNDFNGFTSDYVRNDASIFGEGTYTIGSNPNAVHPSFVSIDGDNPMLLANGAPGNNQVLLGYTGLALVSGNYSFSAQVMNICCNAPFNGAPSTILFQLSQGAGPFNTIASYTTNPPGDAGIANLTTSLSPFFLQAGLFNFRIVDAVTAAAGNDFAIDNLSIEAAAVPGPIVGAGLPGLVIALGSLVVLSRRRRSQAV
jgi:hypothetical protein